MPEDPARVRGAILYTMTTEGNRNLSQFVNRAVMAEVERLEAKYNNGEPFPSVGAREMPYGRKSGPAICSPIVLKTLKISHLASAMKS